ncbi:nucleotidyltransferase [Saccharopolyspora erythraea NRRL 2338]|uniref:Nucleotidyltransferase n=1 Tax=Saccharopolyspora erythraea (strain ATCC 11635 / DSM 40517 / JCM 4748 / NBRC 13426 / NCIMB 8594 / NRRL 2338) TaxID=405948 RepID=A4FGQ2_SACEN|nr:nucleotidyltransferase [Saccharopolyspora erythraea D]QRK93671.1 nucleotidyltransferase domain-containing protein [Saccharopolyspora erythraea]CAM03227.1 nucleotidyltransferase [Saccharopolyspora erythraea NRRL 2338]
MAAEPAAERVQGSGGGETMTAPDAVEHARAVVRQRFPDALVAVLGGSAAEGRLTATSDLDIAVLVPGGTATRRETIRSDGRPVELFVHTRDGLNALFSADAATRRATMQTIYATGIVVLDESGQADRIREDASEQLRSGPAPLGEEAVETKRYGLTDALDDLVDTEDRYERLAVGGYVLNTAADLLCDHHRAWIGGGKWLPRRLLAADARRGAALLDGHLRLCETAEPGALAVAAGEVLELVGGPVREGYARTWRA